MLLHKPAFSLKIHEKSSNRISILEKHMIKLEKKSF